MPTNSMALGSELTKTLLGGSFQKGQLDGAHMAAYESTAALNRAKAEEVQRRAQYQNPANATSVGAAFAGLSDGQGQEVANFQRNGNWGVSPAITLPAEMDGPTRPEMNKPAPDYARPEVIQRYNQGRGVALGNLMGTGDSNIQQMAKAFAELAGQGRIDSAIANPSSIQNFGSAMAASDGKPLFHQGTNGTMNLFSGAENLNDVGKTAALQNRAQANNANASAGEHTAGRDLKRAQIPEAQARTELTRSKIGGTETVTNPDGSVTVVTTGKQKEAKPPTEFQAKAAIYGARAKEAHDILNDLEKDVSPSKYNRLAVAAAGGNGVVGTMSNAFLSDASQRAIQAKRDFINATLRQESGAVIADSEFSNADKQYFPQPGDSAKVIAQKTRNRETAIMGFDNAAGKAKYTAPPIAESSNANSASYPVPNQAQIAHLASNPNLAPAFANKFGKEATDAVLGMGK